MVHEGERHAGPAGFAADRDLDEADRLAGLLAAFRKASAPDGSWADVLDRQLDAARSAVEVPFACVATPGAGGSLAVVAARGGVDGSDPAVGDELAEPLAERAFGEGVTVAVVDSTGAGPLVAAPISPAGEVRGVVMLRGAAGRGVFSALDLAFVDLLADGVARVIEAIGSGEPGDPAERDRKYRELREQVAFAALSRSVATGLLGAEAEDLDAAMTTALREVVEFAGASAAAIYELDLGGSRLHLSHRWAVPRSVADDSVIDPAGTSWLLGRLAPSGRVQVPSVVGLPAGVAAPPGQGPVLWLRLDPEHRFGVARPPEVTALMRIRWGPGHEQPKPAALALLGSLTGLFVGALRSRRTSALAGASAQVLEAVARDEPLDRSLYAVGRLVAQYVLGAEVVVLAVEDTGLRVASGEHRWSPWFAEQPLDLTSPYGQAVVTGQPVLVVDTGHDHRFGVDCVPEARLRALQVIPVGASGHTRPRALIVILGASAPVVMIEGPVRTAALSLAAVALERDDDHRRLAHQATHDPLTGVGNRSALVQRLESALLVARATGRRVAVLYADLDGFKDVNDRYGHDHGDRLLVEVARRIRCAVRTGDLVARSGGDEFVVVCENLDSADQAAVIAEKVHAAVEDQPVELGDASLSVVMSVGVALADPVLDDADRLLRVADLAMYEAKGRGARAEGDRSPQRGLRSRFTVDLVRAISSGALEVHQQPILAFDGRLDGVEVLLRWPGTGHRAVGPERVTRVAAEAGYAAALGRWVRRRALEERSRWPESVATGGRVPRVHVNVAAADALSVGFVVGVLEDLREAGAEADDLVLEFQAGDLRRPDVLDVVAELGRHGVTMMVDGLGGGGLPLTDLVRLPLRGARLGTRITKNLASDPAMSSVAGALVAMCHGVGWVAHSVGIETEAQYLRAQDLGFDAVQGWLVGAAMSTVDLAVWLEARSVG